MRAVTRETIRKILMEFVLKQTRTDYSVEELQRAYPFHSLFFRDDSIIAFKQRRSIVTSMRRTLFPKLARLIAEENYRDVCLDKEFRGTVDGAVADIIDRIVTELRVKQRKPDHAEEVAQVLEGRRGKPRELVVTADLFIGDFPKGPFFAEIKTPLPNLDIAAESKKKILTFIALHRSSNPQAYLAFAYNPFLTREAYEHPFTHQVMDMQNQVLIGEEFWDKIGGSGTYAGLLRLIEQVKNRTSLTARPKGKQ